MSVEPMSDNLQKLFEAALHVREHSYSPYSKFPVGAALQTPDGAIFTATNVENASYPMGTCAEEGAISAMIASGRRQIARILIVADGQGLVTPCGACRQRIREFANSETIIHIGSLTGLTARFTMDALLPESFGPDNLLR